MKTAQQIFDTVSKHLLRQRERSMGMMEWTNRPQALPPDIICMYRGYDGKKCAVGALISDRVYCDVIEGVYLDAYEKGYSADALCALKQVLYESGIDLSDEDTARLLTDLLRVHDKSRPSFWSTRLARVAKKHGLRA